MNKIINNFVEKYKTVLEDNYFIGYIVEIFFKYLNLFYDTKYKIKNKSKNLIISSEFISTIESIYFTYKNNIKEKIKSIVEKNRGVFRYSSYNRKGKRKYAIF